MNVRLDVSHVGDIMIYLYQPALVTARIGIQCAQSPLCVLPGHLDNHCTITDNGASLACTAPHSSLFLFPSSLLIKHRLLRPDQQTTFLVHDRFVTNSFHTKKTTETMVRYSYLFTAWCPFAFHKRPYFCSFFEMKFQ